MKGDRRSTISPDEQTARLDAAVQMLRAGRRLEAIASLRVLSVMAADNVNAYRLLGIALCEVGDLAGAEAALRKALKRAPTSAAIAVGLVEALIGQKKGAEAVQTLAPFVNAQTVNFNLLTWAGLALQSADRAAEASAMFARALLVQPQSAIAHHNLAGALVDEHRYSEAEAHERQARALGIDAAESLVVEGRAMRGQNRLTDAIKLFARAVRQKPDYALAIVELAETVWVASGEAGQAFRIYDEALKLQPGERDISRHKAKLQQELGEYAAAYATVSDAIKRQETVELQIFAAQVAVYFDVQVALGHARRGVAMGKRNEAAQAALAQVHLAMNDPREAARLAEGLTRRLPVDQYGWALLGLAWRMLNDPRYERLYDYENLVVQAPIDTPRGWSSLEGYLDALRSELRPHHAARGHQIGQSMRLGSQNESDLALETTPAIAAFFEAIDGPIRRYMNGLGKGRDPLRGRLTGDYALNGVWSVQLGPGGHHVNHVHPKGWLSSAFHLAIPDDANDGRRGWLQFGEPGIPTTPHVQADHFIKPQRGNLVLFPSYMWHGTIPFAGHHPRLSIAFDAVPK